MIDAIIFDIDGTLWDATEQIQISWNKALKDIVKMDRVIGYEELKSQLGIPTPKIFDNLFPDEPDEYRRKIQHELTSFENEWVKTAPCNIYQGVVDVIKNMTKKYPLFIISNCQAGYIEAFLENTGLGPYIKDFTCPGYTGMDKGENILWMMERHNLKRPAYVGDTIGDKNACVLAKIPFIYAAYGYGQLENEPISIDSFMDLMKIDFESM